MYLLDSNILINFLNGNKKEVNWIKNEKSKDSSLGFSLISRIEVLSLPKLKEEEIFQMEQFLSLLKQTYMGDDVVVLASALRRNLNLTLGDAIITATAISYKAIFVTNDKLLASKVKNLVEVISLNN